MKCLIISSLESAYFQSEVQELSNNLSRARFTVQQLTSNISSMELYRALDNEPTGLVWVSCHVSVKGFVFGEVEISPKELGLFLKQGRSRDLVLNTCFSLQHVVEIQHHANVNIVATVNSEIEDKNAWTYALYLSRRLAESTSLQAAYWDTLSEETSEYRWFPAPKIGENKMAGDGNDELTEIQETVERLEVTLVRLVRALQGDSLMRSKGLIEMVQDLEKRVSTLEHVVDGNKLILTRWGLAIVIAIFVVLIVGFLFLTIKLGGNNIALFHFNTILHDLGLFAPGSN